MSNEMGRAGTPKTERHADTGLTSEQARLLLTRYGPNAVTEERPHPMRVLLGKFWAPVPAMLELALVLEMILGKTVEAAVIAALLVFNALLSFVQESRAQSALALLRRRLALQARVFRDGHWQLLPAARLVPCDVVHLRVGDLVPANVQLADGHLLVDQSALTGEALPVEIEPGKTAYAGTVVRRGEATGAVSATGTRTTFGTTAELVRTAKAASHLERIILQLVSVLVGLDLVLTVAVLGGAWRIGVPWSEILPFALILLIASVPVALPATFTLASALGSLELAKRGVLVTRLSAIEEAAGMDVLCTDKTGTITQNQLAVGAVRPFPPHTSAEVLALAALASDEATQDPIDLAILRTAREHPSIGTTAERLRFLPFDPATKRSEAFVRQDERVIRVVKGAPRVIADLSGSADARVEEDVADLSASGARVLAVATGSAQALSLVGLVALADPPRPDSRALIQRLRELGVRVLMVTGDGPATARAVAAEVGIGENVCPPNGLPEPVDATTLQRFDIYAGILPQDKFRLVQTFQRDGHVVGMTGDGVNDAPALKQADVGIAVLSATDVAKAAASLVLTGPGLSDVVEAVTNSRRIYQRMLTYTLNMSVKKIEIPLFLSLGLLVGGVFVITPLLMVLLIFANDFATMAITTDLVEPSRTPDRWAIRPLVTTALAIALLLLVFNGGVFFLSHDVWRLTLSQTQTLIVAWLVFSSQATVYLVRERRHFWTSRPGRWLVMSTVVDVALVTLFASRGLLMTPIPAVFLGAILVLSLVYLVVADILKTRVVRGGRV